MSKVLLAIDDSPASEHAVNYVAALVQRQKQIAVQIFHAIDPVPPALQEFRGAEDPKEEAVLERELKQKQNSWRAKREQELEPLIERVRLTLEHAGANPEQISCCSTPLIHREDLPEEILKAAHESCSDTIVIGRNSFPWIEEIFSHHLDEELKQKAEGLHVSVVD